MFWTSKALKIKCYRGDDADGALQTMRTAGVVDDGKRDCQANCSEEVTRGEWAWLEEEEEEEDIFGRDAGIDFHPLSAWMDGMDVLDDLKWMCTPEYEDMIGAILLLLSDVMQGFRN